MRLVPAFVVVALVAGGGAGCSGGYGTDNTAAPPPAPPPPPVAPNAVDVRDDYFNPADVTVSSGTTVTWTWRGGLGHNVTFEDGVGSSDTQSSGTHTRSFSNPGTYRYRCTIHSSGFGSGMSGEVVVQ